MKTHKPEFIVTYRCAVCGTESGVTELDTPECTYCNASTEMHLVRKEPITPELIAERLRASADRMMQALESAYGSLMRDPDSVDADEEQELLNILAKAQNLRDYVKQIQLRDPEEEE